MLDRICLYMLNNKLNLDEFCPGDCVIIKLKIDHGVYNIMV